MNSESQHIDDAFGNGEMSVHGTSASGLREKELPEVTLRAPETDDIDMLYLWENDSRQWVSTLAPYHVSRRHIADYVRDFDGNIAQWQLKLVVEAGDEAVGAVDLYDADLRCGRSFVGIYIDSSRRGKGYGTAALRQLTEYAFDVLGLRQLAAMVAVDNEVSLRMFAGSGFVESGCLRSWLRRGQLFVDARLMQLQASERQF